MALPGQSFKRVIVLLLDCGATMQQTLRGDFSDALVAQTEALSSSFASSGGASSPSPLSKKADSTPSQVPLSPDSVPSISAADRSADLSSFHAMKRAARAYVQRLAATSAKVDVGVVCFGSCRTDNPLAPVEGDIQPGDTGDAEEGYKHVEVSLRPESASWKLVQELEKVKNSANRSDAIDGLVVAVDMVEKTYGPKLSQNNVSFLVFSDCQSSPATPEDIPAVRDRLEVLGIRVHFIIVDGSVPTHPGIWRPGDPSARLNQHFVSPLRPALPSLSLVASTLIPLRSFLASPFMTAFYPPPKRLSTKCRVNLEVSKAFLIPVYVFVRTRKEPVPTLRKRVFVGVSRPATRRRTDSVPREDTPGDAFGAEKTRNDQGEHDEDWRDLKVERFYFRANDPERTPVKLGEPDTRQRDGTSIFGRPDGSSEDERAPGAGGDAGVHIQRLYAYRYGKQLVAVSGVEQQAFKQQTTAGLVVLGVTRRDSIQRWWNLGPPEYVTCALNNRPSLVALRSLVLALQRLDSVLLCSFVWRGGYPAKLVALLPHVGGGNREKRKAWQATASLKESDDVKREEETNQKEAGDEDKTYGLHLIYLPVAEDMLELRLPSLPSVTPRQLRAVETLVESLTLPGSPQVSVKSGEKGGRASEKDEGDREAEKKPIDGEWEEVEAQRKALQAPASSPAGWQTNAPLEIAVDPSTRVHSPSPPCSSAAFPSFLPDSISSFATKSESLSLHKIHNPTLQRYYQLLVYRHYNPASPPVALGEEGSETQAQTTWREAEESHQHRLHHMWARGSPVERLFTVRTPGCLDSEQPDASVEQTKEAGQRETQVDAALKAAFPQATSLEAQTAGRRQREVQQKLLFGEVVRKQKELVVRDVKVSGEWTEPHFDTPGEEPRMTAEARREETEKLERAIEEEERQKKLEALKALHVHSVNPVRDFQRLLEVKETDLTEKAIQEMTEMIFKFLRAAGPPQGALERPTGAGRGGETSGLQNFRRQQHLGKALVCVEALREGCRRELEGEKFNEFLAEVKAEQCRADAAADDSFRTFWNLLKSRKIGLITHAEDPRVDLEPAQSLRIYEDESVQELSTQTAMTAARPLDPHDVDDLLDLVE
uniref:Ku70/Ku80 beta-barrel domain-containing protein n=1 Tax=Toxoplasma gondii COUG TaxID=1074873 RepID=A0A2G8XTW9_TOXGO|nr:Ku70/Ku80 beta-barrel domain-containing protein [Toxoplasma gondii COUG]